MDSDALRQNPASDDLKKADLAKDLQTRLGTFLDALYDFTHDPQTGHFKAGETDSKKTLTAISAGTDLLALVINYFMIDFDSRRKELFALDRPEQRSWRQRESKHLMELSDAWRAINSDDPDASWHDPYEFAAWLRDDREMRQMLQFVSEECRGNVMAAQHSLNNFSAVQTEVDRIQRAKEI